MTETFEAESLEAAKAKAEEKAFDDNTEFDLDDVDDVDFDVRELHPVTRGDRELWTTYVKPDDVRGHQSTLATSPLFGGPA